MMSMDPKVHNARRSGYRAGLREARDEIAAWLRARAHRHMSDWRHKADPVDAAHDRTAGLECLEVAQAVTQGRASLTPEARDAQDRRDWVRERATASPSREAVGQDGGQDGDQEPSPASGSTTRATAPATASPSREVTVMPGWDAIIVIRDLGDERFAAILHPGWTSFGDSPAEACAEVLRMHGSALTPTTASPSRETT